MQSVRSSGETFQTMPEHGAEHRPVENVSDVYSRDERQATELSRKNVKSLRIRARSNRARSTVLQHLERLHNFFEKFRSTGNLCRESAH